MSTPRLIGEVAIAETSGRRRARTSVAVTDLTREGEGTLSSAPMRPQVQPMEKPIDQTRAGAQIVATVIPCSIGVKDMLSAYFAVNRKARKMLEYLLTFGAPG